MKSIKTLAFTIAYVISMYGSSSSEFPTGIIATGAKQVPPMLIATGAKQVPPMVIATGAKQVPPNTENNSEIMRTA